MRRFYLAAKAPRPGHVKTRLIPELGAEAAARLYRGFLLDLADRFPAAGWFVEPGAGVEIAALVENGCRPPLRWQRGEDWAVRQHNLFADTAAAGELPLVLAASDSPQLEPALVEAAFAGLERADLVFGPTFDGGYYLVGMRRPADVLLDVPMSTGSALECACRRAREQGLSAVQLPPTFDVDTPADLELLRAELERRPDLRHTAAALQVMAVA